jgi:cation diffusion facilitator CzcD-associated flavoprotein CzcO
VRAAPLPAEVEVAVLGAGFSGLCAGAKLREAGRTDFVILDQAHEIGGTWRDNRYPGAACDVPSHLYSLSFAPKPDWSRRYATQPEIFAYMRELVPRLGLGPHLRLGRRVVELRWLADRGRWRLRTADGEELLARFVIHGIGALRDPKLPDLPGLADFGGPVVHSARWPEGLDLRGQRVAVLGTGASAVQLVPALAPEVRQMTVLQRSPAWVVPRRDSAYPSWLKRAFALVPALMVPLRLWIYLIHESRYPVQFGAGGPLRPMVRALLERHIRAQVADPALAERLIPRYEPGCKRVLVSDDWYPALQLPQVRLETEAVARVERGALVLADGRRVEADALICCTGFEVDKPLGQMKVYGEGGADLDAVWAGRPQGWLGIGGPGFPNSFMLLGPNTALGHNSVLVMIEAQVRYVVQAIAEICAHGPDAHMAPQPEALADFMAEVDSAHAGQIWASGCQSWYLNAAGQNFTIYPGSTLSYLWRTRRFDPERWTLGRAPPEARPTGVRPA